IREHPRGFSSAQGYAWWSQATGYQDSFMQLLRMVREIRSQRLEFENTPEDSPQPKARVVVPGAPGRHQDSFISAAQDEFENTPEDSPQPKARVVVPGHRETPGQLHAAAQDVKGDQITEAG
ncbi:Polyserase-2, partial [Manis pentadactyla]